MLSKEDEYYLELYLKRDVYSLAYLFFGVELTPSQENIVEKILYDEYRRVCINCMTRYGKSFSVAVGVNLSIYFHTYFKWALIAPQTEQSELLRNYLIELIFKSPQMQSIVDFEIKGKDRAKKEASRKRQTFRNGCEYRVFSAYHEANRLMGMGANAIICDESCLINSMAWTKILRMLGDDPDNAKMVELANPWNRDNKYYEHWTNPEFIKIHVGWKTALKEGRTTQRFIDEMRGEMTPIEFKVLYDSEFPDQSEDSIFSLSKVIRATKNDFKLDVEFKKLQKKLKESWKLSEADLKSTKEKFNQFTKIISCDAADKGLDETVIYWGYKKGAKYQIVGIYTEPISENMQIAGRIVRLMRVFIGKNTKGLIHNDCIGLGEGPISRIKEVKRDKGFKNIKIVGCHFGKAPLDKDRFKNKKAENYFRLKAIMDENNIQIPSDKEIIKQLIKMRWKFTSSAKIIIEDPEEKTSSGSSKSPDRADALVYFTWKDNNTFLYSV